MQDLRRHTRRGREINNPPSFSSTLLDAIYRSIDESNDKVDNEDNNDNMIFYREAKGMKACMIEKWIDEEHTYEKKVSIRRKSMADLSSRNNNRNNIQPVLLNSSSSSSESSCGGGFSSSESESVIIQRPKPIRTSVSAQSEKYQTGGVQNRTNRNCAPDGRAAKHESSSFVKTKSKALKIYGDLKKVKQPISPGGRLATFLNSIFTAGNAKKAKFSSSYDDERKFKSEQTSTCSSASSFSRSCLSKTPSSRANNNDGAKRSVRFYPVSVIVGEDSRPCGQKNVYENHQISTTNLRNSNSKSKSKSNSKSNSINETELKYRVMNESRRVEEVARDLLKNYHQKKQKEEEEEEEEEDDGASCASSDLFELDNLSAIGIDQRYREELPVYETTYLTTNRAIANGLFM